jgi:hypothetical protein
LSEKHNFLNLDLLPILKMKFIFDDKKYWNEEDYLRKFVHKAKGRGTSHGHGHGHMEFLPEITDEEFKDGEIKVIEEILRRISINQLKQLKIFPTKK